MAVCFTAAFTPSKALLAEAVRGQNERGHGGDEPDANLYRVSRVRVEVMLW